MLIFLLKNHKKDISELAAYKYFANEMLEPQNVTNNEGLILRNSEMIVESIEPNYPIKFRDEPIELKNKIKAKQIK